MFFKREINLQLLMCGISEQIKTSFVLLLICFQKLVLTLKLMWFTVILIDGVLNNSGFHIDELDEIICNC